MEIKSLGLGRDLTVIAVFSTECQECRALLPFYEQIAGLPGMDGVRKTFIVFTTSGVIPTKAVFDKHKFVPHRLISCPVIGTIDLPSEPPSLTIFDATATSRGQWKGPLTPAQQQEVLAILGKQ